MFYLATEDFFSEQAFPSGLKELSFSENLSYFSAPLLKEMARIYEIKKLSNRKKDNLVEYLSIEIPKNMHKVLGFLSPSSIDFLSKVIKHSKVYITMLPTYVLNELIYSGLIVLYRDWDYTREEKAEYYVTIPKGIKKIVAKSLRQKIDVDTFRQREIHNYILMATHLYGWISFDSLTTLFNHHHKKSLSKKELTQILKQYHLSFRNFDFDDTYLWTREITKNDLQMLIKNFDNNELFLPDKKVIAFYADMEFTGLCDGFDPIWKMLQHYYMYFGYDEIDAMKKSLEATQITYILLQYGTDLADILSDLEKHYNINFNLDIIPTQHFHRAIVTLHNNMRYWRLRGKTIDDTH